MTRTGWAVASSALLALAAPVAAQDMWESQMDNTQQAQGSYWSSATSNAIYSRAQNRATGEGSGTGSPTSRGGSDANSRRICGDARRGVFAQPDRKQELLTLCAKVGY